jgi:hypothetical protein
MFFEGDQHPLNPARYLPTPFHTKFAQDRTALSQYIQQESVGTRMRRWERPFHDFLMPYLRGTVERTTGVNIIPAEVEHRRDLDTPADSQKHLVSLLSKPPLPDFESAPAPSPTESGNSRLFSHIQAILRSCLSARAGHHVARPLRALHAQETGLCCAVTGGDCGEINRLRQHRLGRDLPGTERGT